MDQIGKMDIGLKVSAALGGTFLAAAAVIVPNDNQKKAAALALFDKPLDTLTPQEKRTAEFAAGYKRWNCFVHNNIYSWTRKLPGADNPIVNPYKGPRARPQQKIAAEVEQAQEQ